MFPYIIAIFATIASLAIRPATASEISAQTLFELTNQVRVSQGLPTLDFSDRLEKAALAKAEDMVETGYFDHFGPAGQTPWQFMEQANYHYDYGGENLAIGFTSSQEIIQAWLDSPTHRQNLLEPNYEDVGIAVLPALVDGLPDYLVVQMFGSLVKPNGEGELTSYINDLLGVSDVIAE